jgi:hypothetical protein
MLSWGRIGPLTSGDDLDASDLECLLESEPRNEPTSSPASTAAMTPSVEFMSIEVRSCCRRTSPINPDSSQAHKCRFVRRRSTETQF